MGNISWLFYKDYFRGMTFEKDNESDKKLIKTKNAKLTEAKLVNIDAPFNMQRINAIIRYPGLVSGTGINHEANILGEFKLGVHFDYTFGMPVIYGSSIKGLLRSAFPESEVNINKVKDETKKDKLLRLRDAKIDLVRRYLGKGFENMDVDKLRDNIFDGIKQIDAEGKNSYNSVYERDIFFDAVIVKTNKKNKILDSDSITPHKIPLQEPVPITFLKIASGCTIEFRFDLKPVKINGIDVSASNKIALFKKILLDLGIGAKTNVGYGQLSE